MFTATDIKKAEQKLARLERNKAMQKIKERRLDTRRKIQLGGLVIKAGMDKYSKEVILGALVDDRQRMENDVDLKRSFSLLGKSLFLKN